MTFSPMYSRQREEFVQAVTAEVQPLVDQAAQSAALAASYATDGGALLPNVWTRLPAMYAIRLRGIGTVTIEIKTADDVIRSGGDPLKASGVTRVAYPFFGEDAAYARATLTGTASAEVF